MMMMMSGTLQPAGQAPQQPQKPRYVDTNNAPQVVGVNNIGQPQPPAVALLPNTQPVSDVYLNAPSQPNTVGAPAYPTPLVGGSNLINSNGGGSGVTVPIDCTAIEQVQVPSSVNGGGMRTISVQKQLPASITIPMDGGGGGMTSAMSPTMTAPMMPPPVPNGMAMVPVASLANPTANPAGGLNQLPPAPPVPVSSPEATTALQQPPPPAEAPKEGPNWFAWTALGAGALAAIFLATRGKGTPNPTGNTGGAAEAAVKQLDAMWHNLNPAKLVNADDVTYQKGNPLQKGLGAGNHMWGINHINYGFNNPLWKTGLTQNAKNAHKALRQVVTSTPKKELAASTEAFHALGQRFTEHVGGGDKHLGRALRETYNVINQAPLGLKEREALQLAFLEGAVSNLSGKRAVEVLRAAVQVKEPFHKDHHAAIAAFVESKVPDAKQQAYVLKKMTGLTSINKEFVPHTDRMADSYFAHTPPAELLNQAGVAGPVAAPVAGMVPATA